MALVPEMRIQMLCRISRMDPIHSARGLKQFRKVLSDHAVLLHQTTRSPCTPETWALLMHRRHRESRSSLIGGGSTINLHWICRDFRLEGLGFWASLEHAQDPTNTA